MRRLSALPFLYFLFSAPAAAQAAPHDSVRGTVRTVDTRARTVEVTSGVGLALRVVRLTVSQDTRVTAAGTALPFTQLRPGDIIHVAFGSRRGGLVAYTIDRVGRLTAEGAGSP